MGYHENKAYSVYRQSYGLASKHFESPWFRCLDDYKILMKVRLIKPNHLLSILNQINNNIQLMLTNINIVPTQLFVIAIYVKPW